MRIRLSLLVVIGSASLLFTGCSPGDEPQPPAVVYTPTPPPVDSEKQRLEHLRQELREDITEAQLHRLLGRPESRAELGTKSILRYPEAEVQVESGRVIDVRWRDLQRERQFDQQRGLMAARQRQVEADQAASSAMQTQSSGGSYSGYNSYYSSGSASYTRRIPESERRQERIVYLQNRITSEQQILDRYSRQSSFKQPEYTLISRERAELANQRIKRWEDELIQLR